MKHGARTVWGGAALLLLAFAQDTLAAEAASGAAMAQAGEQVLEGVLVQGQRPIEDRQVVLEWMQRLVDSYRVTGTVTLHRNDGEKTLETTGRAECTALPMQLAPAVHCELLVPRPDFGEELRDLEDASMRAPAVIVLGYAFDNSRIRHLLVEGEGKAEGGAGSLISADVMLSRAPCLNAQVPCERVLRVTVKADLSDVRMEIGFETGDRRVLTQTFTMHRE